MISCDLRWLAQELNWPPCHGGSQMHHVLNRSLLKGNEKALALVNGKYKHLFVVPVCMGHNVSRFADTAIARGYLLSLADEGEMRKALEELRACFKGGYPKLCYEGLLAEWHRHLDGPTYAKTAEG